MVRENFDIAIEKIKDLAWSLDIELVEFTNAQKTKKTLREIEKKISKTLTKKRQSKKWLAAAGSKKELEALIEFHRNNVISWAAEIDNSK